jgi:RNA polymerase sigma-70 factor (family 1)
MALVSIYRQIVSFGLVYAKIVYIGFSDSSQMKKYFKYRTGQGEGSTSLKGDACFENEIVLQLSKKDTVALRTLVEAYFPVLCRFAEKFVSDPSTAQDIVQETFIKFWQYEGHFESFSGLKAFLYTVTRNGCLNLQRGREREKKRYQSILSPDIPEEDPIYDEIIRLEYLQQVNQAIRELPLKMREVFLLSFEEGLSIEEIAQKMNISVKTVRNQKYKSLVLLRKRFARSAVELVLLLPLLLK